MKKYISATASVFLLLFSSVSVSADEGKYNDFESSVISDTYQPYYRYLAEFGSESNKHTFSNAASVADDIVKILNRKCGYDISIKTLDWVTKESSIYAFMLALNSVSESVYPAYRNAFEEVLECNDLNSSIEKLRSYYK